MLSAGEKDYILDRAYVPEHCIRLMTFVSGGEPFLIDDHFICRKENWVILVGYPLKDDFTVNGLEAVLSKIKKKFHSDFISLVAPELPPSLASVCRESDSDAYFTLETKKPRIRSPVKRNLRKARQLLRVEKSATMQAGHSELMQEFMARSPLPARVETLLLKMPDFVADSDQAFVLNARNKADKLIAFYVVDVEARGFSNYIIGCHSKKNYVPGASDLLLSKLIDLSLEYGKPWIHLGLGVNAGIRRFKEKWGAMPTRRYEMCELTSKKSSILDTLRAFANIH